MAQFYIIIVTNYLHGLSMQLIVLSKAQYFQTKFRKFFCRLNVIMCYSSIGIADICYFCENENMSLSFAVFHCFQKFLRYCSENCCVYPAQLNLTDHRHMTRDL